MSENVPRKSMTLDEIAERLSLSKTTVSRAISGKGRISADTRLRVLDYVRASGYAPNADTARLKAARTGCLGVILPSDQNTSDTPFFLSCLVGICETATLNGCAVMVITDGGSSVDCLKDMINKRRVDGILLTRTLYDDARLDYLRSTGFPYIVIGSSRDKTIPQVDVDVPLSCAELTKILIGSSESLAFLAGDQSHRVQRLRYEGYLQAFLDCDMVADKSRVFLNTTDRESAAKAMRQLMDEGVDCIIAADDVICMRAVNWLDSHKYRIPQDVRIASFYNSVYLTEHNPPITAISINPKEMGVKAAKALLRAIDGQPTRPVNLINYEILMRKSTMRSL